jgi:septum formation protein
MKLILASASPRRRQLLKKSRIPFKVIPSHVSERSSLQDPKQLVQELALRKAKSVAKGLALIRPSATFSRVTAGEGRARDLPSPAVTRERAHDFVVLGADTVVVLRGKILGKPRDEKDAYRMLYRLSGSTHRVYTGVALVDASSGKSLVTHAVSVVRMKKIGLEELMKLSRKHLDKAGSYAIQEKRDPIARVVKGSYDNVVGLPVKDVKALLKKLSRDV